MICNIRVGDFPRDCMPFMHTMCIVRYYTIKTRTTCRTTETSGPFYALSYDKYIVPNSKTLRRVLGNASDKKIGRDA